MTASFNDAVERIQDYHRRTKHHLNQYARSAGYLDWANQPDPFRTYSGAPRIELQLGDVDTRYDDLYRPAASSQPLGLSTLGIFFELALGLSAWKEFGASRWALRCNPSSGNLHPTEGYAILPELPGVRAGVYHYVSHDHCLERRCTFSDASIPPPPSPPPQGGRGEEMAGSPTQGGRGEACVDATQQLESLPQGSFSVGLTSIHWREAWKYGERAYRYCQHDAGHALAALRLAAAVLGWSARLVGRISDAELALLLGVDRSDDFAALDPLDREQPDALLLVEPVHGAGDTTQVLTRTHDTGFVDGRRQFETMPFAKPQGVPPDHASHGLEEPILAWLRDSADHGAWTGKANRLSGSHVDWPIIDRAAQATWKSATGPEPSITRTELPPIAPSSNLPAARIIRQRRSCLALDGQTSIPAATFYRMLDHLLPRPQIAPWDMLPWEPLVHLALFVHRVDGLPPGLYLFERAATVHERLREAVTAKAEWQRVPGCPEHLRLFFLVPGDCRQMAGVISCHQEIAADGAFSLGMIADFGDTLRQRGAWWYRRLFWESGAVGQVLYLEAEAAGIRSTGIGCYFDDACHAVLRLESDRFQSLYHFTVGGPIDDPRLTTLPAYGHLPQSRREFI